VKCKSHKITKSTFNTDKSILTVLHWCRVVARFRQQWLVSRCWIFPCYSTTSNQPHNTSLYRCASFTPM